MQARSTTTSTKGIPPAAGLRPDKGNGRPGKNGSNKAGAGTSAVPGFGFHLLASGLRSLPLYEIAMMRKEAPTQAPPGLLKMIDTEAKQLQAIEDLYLIVKAQPKYKSLKEPSWTAETKPLIVIDWLLRKLAPLAKGDNWTIDTYKVGNKMRYRFVVYREYHSQRLRNQDEHIPIDFLPSLRKRDQPLHDLIIDMVALVSRCNKVPLWDEDGDFSKALDTLLDVPKGGYTVYNLERQAKLYSTGPAGDHLRLIKGRRDTVSFEEVERQIRKYEAASERKRCALYWVKQGIAVARSGKCIVDNTYVPHFIPGNPITPFRLYKFVWSQHKNDVVKINTYAAMNRDEPAGQYVPVEFSITYPGDVVQPVKEDKFPMDLFEFLTYGYSHFLGRYRDYYYKETLEADEPPGMRMLIDIEMAEMRKKILDEQSKHK